MIVVVSAIVDPWVTTLSFVVALAMRIQAENIKESVDLPDFAKESVPQIQILCTFQARIPIAADPKPGNYVFLGPCELAS